MSQATKRLFLGLWPDDETRRKVLELQKQLNYDHGLSTASPVDDNNIHITLHFLGSVPENNISILTHALDGVAANCFDMRFDRLGYFSKPKILWLGCSHPPDDINQLYKNMLKAIKKCMPGYRSKKYIPHVTLFRKASELPQKEQIEAIPWHIDSFVLVESKTYPEGVQYRILEQWPLMH